MKKRPADRIWSIHPRLMDNDSLADLHRVVLRYTTRIKNGTLAQGYAIGLARIARREDVAEVMGLYADTVQREMLARGGSPTLANLPVGEPGRVILRRGQLKLEWRVFRERIGQVISKWAPGGMMFDAPLEPSPIFILIDGPREPWDPTPVVRKRFNIETLLG